MEFNDLRQLLRFFMIFTITEIMNAIKKTNVNMKKTGSSRFKMVDTTLWAMQELIEEMNNIKGMCFFIF